VRVPPEIEVVVEVEELIAELALTIDICVDLGVEEVSAADDAELATIKLVVDCVNVFTTEELELEAAAIGLVVEATTAGEFVFDAEEDTFEVLTTPLLTGFQSAVGV